MANSIITKEAFKILVSSVALAVLILNNTTQLTDTWGVGLTKNFVNFIILAVGVYFISNIYISNTRKMKRK